MKYAALKNDNEIAINFIKAILKSSKKRSRSISDNEYKKLKKDVKKLRAEGYTANEIKDKLNITQHRINSIVSDL